MPSRRRAIFTSVLTIFLLSGVASAVAATPDPPPAGPVQAQYCFESPAVYTCPIEQAGAAVVSASDLAYVLGQQAAEAGVDTPSAAPDVRTSTCTTESNRYDLPTSQNVNYACSESVIVLTTPSATGQESDWVTRFGADRAVNVTSVDPQYWSAVAAQLPVETLAPATASTSASSTGPRYPYDSCKSEGRTKVSSYVASSYHDIYYGTRENGKTIFSSCVRLSTKLNLQARNHRITVSWYEKTQRSIGLTIPVRMREDIRFHGDRTVDTISANNPFAGSSYTSGELNIKTDRAGKFFAEAFNMTINDRTYGTFRISSTAQTTRFRCYASANRNCTF